jgi:nucleotide-binding universal stress UspA family protein
VDGSQHSEASVDEIIRRKLPPGSEVRIISVAETPFLPSGGDAVGLYDEVEKRSRKLATDAVEKASARLRASGESGGLTVAAEVLSGSAKEVIVEDAETFGADLIVVGSHGHGGLERFLLGSVSQAVAMHAKCSVEIVRSRK